MAKENPYVPLVQGWMLQGAYELQEALFPHAKIEQLTGNDGIYLPWFKITFAEGSVIVKVEDGGSDGGT